MKYHLTPVKMAIIKKPTNESAREGVEKREPPTLLMGKQTGTATMENNMQSAGCL